MPTLRPRLSHLSPLLLAPLLALSLAPASAQTYTLVVGAQASPLPAVTVQGQTYVPLSALKTLGVPYTLSGRTLTLGAPGPATAPGGANARAALEGCVGQTLFNGIWRLTVQRVDPIPAGEGLGPGWGVTVELRNGTATTTALLDTGLGAVDLVLPDGNTLVFAERSAEAPFLYKSVSQAGGVTYQLKFRSQSAQTPAGSVPAPAKLIMQFDPARLTAGYLKAAKVAYTTPTPTLRVDLTCRK